MGCLVGVKEASEILGWDRRKVSTYHLRGILPKPVTSLSSGPIWFRTQIELYKSSKETGISAYYINNGIVYECKYNCPIKETILSPDVIKEGAGYLVFKEEDIKKLVKIIRKKNLLAQFLSFESVNFLHDLGILKTDVFEEYIHQYLCENHKEGLDKE